MPGYSRWEAWQVDRGFAMKREYPTSAPRGGAHIVTEPAREDTGHSALFERLQRQNSALEELARSLEFEDDNAPAPRSLKARA